MEDHLCQPLEKRLCGLLRDVSSRSRETQGCWQEKDVPSYSGMRYCRTAWASGGFLPHKTMGIADMLDAEVNCSRV